MAEVWLKDVAKAAGVSVSAASHAINGTGTLSQKRRAEILEVAARLGYQRNPLLSRLAARRFRTSGRRQYVPVGYVGFVGENPRLELQAEVPVGLLQEMGKPYGFTFDQHHVVRSRQAAEKLLGSLYRRGVETLLIGGTDLMSLVRTIDLSRFCVLGVGDIDSEFPYNKVERDWSDAVRICFSKLRQAGCRRIGGQFLGGEGQTYQDRLRLGAYLSEQAAHKDIELIPPLLLESDGFGLREAFNEWYFRERPDGIVAWSLDPVYGLLEQGIRMPEDVQVALIYRHLDDPWYDPFAGVTRNLEVGVRQSLRILFDQLTHGERGRPEVPMTHRIRYAWIDGPSVRSGTL